MSPTSDRHAASTIERLDAPDPVPMALVVWWCRTHRRGARCSWSLKPMPLSWQPRGRNGLARSPVRRRQPPIVRITPRLIYAAHRFDPISSPDSARPAEVGTRSPDNAGQVFRDLGSNRDLALGPTRAGRAREAHRSPHSLSCKRKFFPGRSFSIAARIARDDRAGACGRRRRYRDKTSTNLFERRVLGGGDSNSDVAVVDDGAERC